MTLIFNSGRPHHAPRARRPGPSAGRPPPERGQGLVNSW